MRRSLMALALAVLALAGCQPEAPPAGPVGKPALWVIETPQGAAAGWLFGTIHALPDGARWQTPVLERAVAQAGMLVVEVRDLDPQAVAKSFDHLSHDCPCPPLASRVPPSARPQLAQVLTANDLAPQHYDGLESWAAALALANADPKATARAANGADREIIARFAGRPVAEFEGAAAQLEIFDRLPEAAQRRMLTEVITGTAKATSDADRLARAWLAADLAVLEQETRQGLLADPVLYRALLAGRNAAWLARLEPLLAQRRRPFVAVGAAHLLGPDGLVARLSHAGYRVRRLQ